MINFDFPADTDSYIHRVGRTARGNNKGSALSLIAARELERAQKVEKGNAFSVFHFTGVNISHENQNYSKADPKILKLTLIKKNPKGNL